MVYRAEITCCDCTSGCFSRLYPNHTDLIGLHCDWCSDRLHLVVVTSSPSCLFLSYSLDSLLLITILGPVALSSGLSFSSSPQPFPTTTSCSAPHVQYCAAPTPPFPLLLIFHNPLSLHYSLHLKTVRLGRTAGGSPHSFVLVQDLSASGTETETTHSQCCGFGRKIFVELLPVSALWAVPSDRLIC